ncbi:MAG: alpha/beta hydrolase, partial [Candidatus Cryptobacteroides sp.]
MSPKAKKIFLYTITGIAAIYLLAVVITPIIAIEMLSGKHVNYSRVFTSEEAGLPVPDTLWTETSDGYRIHTLELKPEGSPKAAVICLTGIENPSVTYFYGHARLFYEMGLVTLMPEVRGHGLSDGDNITLAYKETADVKSISDYVTNTYNDIPIIVMGLSMGGAIAIRSIGENPDIDALISVSGYSSVEDVISGFIGNIISRPLAWPTKLPTRLYASLKFRVNAFKDSPLKAIGNLNGRPALLMHSRKDSQVPFSCFEKLSGEASKATDRLRTYVVDA